MSNKIEIRSKSLSALNEAIRKANYFGINIVNGPLKENNEFVSVLSATPGFDSDMLKNDQLTVKGLSKDKQKEKAELTNEILDKINDTLKVNKEIYSLLDKVKAINSQDDSNRWVRNKEKNTAELAKHGAKLFLQNNNICLSHNGKIEIFKSVSDLHAWLNENDYPIPHDIKLHEAKEKLNEFKILNDKGFARVISGNENPYPEYTTSDHKTPVADPNGWYLTYPKGDKGTIYYDDDRNPINYSGDKSYLRYDWQKYKSFKDVLTPDINYAFMFKSKKHAEAQQIMLFSRFMKNFIPVKPLDSNNPNICLQYVGADYTGTSSDKPEYLPRDWETSGILFTVDVDRAKKFHNLVQARKEQQEIAKKYANLELKYRPVTLENDQITECGTTTASLGPAVTYTADNKENLDEASLRGYAGTPFENKEYFTKVDRASEYLKWIFNTNDEFTNLDPNFSENYITAVKEFEAKQRASRADDLWGSVYSSTYAKEHPMFRKVIDPKTRTIKRDQKYIDTVNEINSKYGINLNPGQDVIGKNISMHNKEQKRKWREYFDKHIYKPGTMVTNSELKKLRYQSGDGTESSPIEKTVKDLKNMHLTAANNPQMYGKDGAEVDTATVTDYLTKIINKYKDQIKDKTVYNQVIDKFIDANEEFPKNNTLDQAILDKLRELKDAKQSAEPVVTLKEDDTPEDFATGGNDVAADVNLDTEVSTDDSNVDLNNMLPENPEMDTEGSDAPSFGDININSGSGVDGYGPDDEENAEAMPSAEQYIVLDVLANTEDNSDIRVKIKNVDTNEIKICDLSEIDL